MIRTIALAATLSHAVACGGDGGGSTGDASTTTDAGTTTDAMVTTGPGTTTDASTSTTATTTDPTTTAEPTTTTDPTTGGDPVCGDGEVQAGEDCDDGNQDDTDECLSTCAAAACGDGEVQAGVEPCDDGNQSDDDLCLTGCVLASCGDGFVGPGEACDDGNPADDDGCTNACALPSCGDGALQGAEECDDGNDVNDDECLSTCLTASCGDNVVQAGVEACDDANDLDTDECPGTCQLATCGDGFVQEGVEGCDDANDLDDDGCVDGCKLASCGDGFVQAGAEVCDDGNLVDEDGCQSDCTQTPGVTQVATGWYHTCALTTDGDVRCWGRNNYGQLGQGNTVQIGDDELPSTIPPVDIGTKAQALVAGENHTCALVEGGKVRCWGRANAGQLGLAAVNNIGDNEQPWSVSDVPLGLTATALAAGRDHTCALVEGGKVRCWGASTYGQLGHGNVNNVGDNETPASAGDVDIGGVATHIAAGEYHSCALLDDGKIRCWGYGTNGTLGYGNVNHIGDDEAPGSVGPISLGANATSITAGRRHTCAITTDQSVRCWGLNSNGQLGLVNTTTIGDNEDPAQAGVVGPRRRQGDRPRPRLLVQLRPPRRRQGPLLGQRHLRPDRSGQPRADRRQRVPRHRPGRRHRRRGQPDQQQLVSDLHPRPGLPRPLLGPLRLRSARLRQHQRHRRRRAALVRGHRHGPALNEADDDIGEPGAQAPGSVASRRYWAWTYRENGKSPCLSTKVASGTSITNS
jgi:cysteine-rich repeat protein